MPRFGSCLLVQPKVAAQLKPHGSPLFRFVCETQSPLDPVPKAWLSFEDPILEGAIDVVIVSLVLIPTKAMAFVFVSVQWAISAGLRSPLT